MTRLRFVHNIGLWQEWHLIAEYFTVFPRLSSVELWDTRKSEHVLAAGTNIKLTGH